MLGHVALGILTVGQHQRVLAGEIVQQLRVRHPCLGGNIPQGDTIQRLVHDTRFQRGEYLSADGILIHDQGHEIYLLYEHFFHYRARLTQTQGCAILYLPFGKYKITLHCVCVNTSYNLYKKELYICH